jgi:hypothetical protein
MAVPNMEKVIHPNTFIITASVLGWSEEQFFEVLIEKYPEDLDFRKIRTPVEYLEFRSCLATKFLSNASLDILRKTSIALFSSNTVASSIQPVPNPIAIAQPKVTVKSLTKRQGKNRRSRKNKSSKAPTEPPVVDHFTQHLTDLGWPTPQEPPIKRARIEVPFEPKTPTRAWVDYMPVCNFAILEGNPEPCYQMQKVRIKELCTIDYHVWKNGKFASRSISEAEYRHDVGIHRQEDECDICDCAYRFHFLDDFAGVQTRIIALIALHHWIQHGAKIHHFNWCPQSWMDDMFVDGEAIPISAIGPVIRRYIDGNRVKKSNMIISNMSPDRLSWTEKKGKDPDPANCFRLTR